jgi:hypothetical protein
MVAKRMERQRVLYDPHKQGRHQGVQSSRSGVRAISADVIRPDKRCARSVSRLWKDETAGQREGGARGRNRTCGLLLRRQTLYPLSYAGGASHIPKGCGPGRIAHASSRRTVQSIVPAAPMGRSASGLIVGAAYLTHAKRREARPEPGPQRPALLAARSPARPGSARLPCPVCLREERGHGAGHGGR